MRISDFRNAAESEADMDSIAKVTNVKNQVGFDPATTLPTQNVVVTFMVGHHGPFTLTYKQADYTPDRVNQDIATQIETLRHIGAISQG